MQSTLKKNKVFALFLLISFLIPMLIFDIIPMTNDKALNQIHKESQHEEQFIFSEEQDPKLSISYSNYQWWNNSWDYRVPVDVFANGAEQNDVPVEIIVNFTDLADDEDLGDINFELNGDSIRVIEYDSATTYYEIDCQFDKYSTYDNKSNAIGEVVWIMNGTTAADETREYFIYFDNGTDADIPSWPYSEIRIWHEGFEDNFDKTKLKPLQPGSQDINANSHWVVDNVAARGDKSYLIRGNCWKAHDLSTTPINIGGTSYTATAKMRFDDAVPNKDISGIGFWNTYTGPLPADSYEIRGVQNWGEAGVGVSPSKCKYGNQYYAPNTFFWYTFNLDSELSTNTIKYIVYIADDDSDYGGFFNFTLYWDDISIWNQEVQTVPDHIITTSLGEIEPISYTLKIICKDVDGYDIPNAQVYVTNKTTPGYDKQGVSDEDGIVFFSNMNKDLWYNITINYTQQGVPNPKTETVNTSLIKITVLNTEITAILDLWTMNFTVYDVDVDPIQYGYVVINDGSTDVSKAYLDESGNCTIRWRERANYQYRIYFDYTLLTDGSIYSYDNLLIQNNTISNTINYKIVDTLISKANFSILDENNHDFENCVLRIYNESDYKPNGAALSEIIAYLTCDDLGNATFYSFNNETSASWGNYSVEFFFAGKLWDITANPYLNDNFTLNHELYLSYKVLLTKDNYISNFTLRFTDPSDLSDGVVWGEEFIFQYNFTITDRTVPTTSQATPDNVYYQIFSSELEQLTGKISIPLVDIIEISTGILNITLNTSKIGLIGGRSYFIEISAIKLGYNPQETIKSPLNVIALPASLTIHQYGGLYPVISEVSEFYDEFLNISLRYYYSTTGETLKGATLHYNWQHGSGIINADPLNDNYYTFTIDTSEVDTTGTYIITIDAYLDNYTYIGARPFNLQVLARRTSLNNEADPLDKRYNLYIEDAVNYTFILKDLDRNKELTDLSEAYYRWYKLSEAGDVLSGPSNLISLINTENGYILDFDTETREVGIYLLRLTLGKTNYETQTLDINLEILQRTIDTDLNAKGLNDDQLNIVKGKTVTIEMELTDPTQGDIPIEGAEVVLKIGNKEFEFDEKGDGVYELEFDTEDYEAFYTSQTLTGEIEIKKANYETENIDITIVVEMEELYPGIPTFYFIMFVGAIVAVAGSLSVYKYIQIARIPKFVKKARAMKHAIKSRKDIPESALTNSKEELIFKEFGDEWEEFGLSLRDMLGLKVKKEKISIGPDKLSKNNGGGQ